MSSGIALRKLFAAATAVAAGVVSAGLMGPGPAGAAALPDLKVTVDVTPVQAAYYIGDAVITTFTVTNVGDATATKVWVKGGGDEGLNRSKFILQDPFDLAPGESREIGWDGDVDPSARATGAAQGSWEFTNEAGEANPADNTASYRLPLPQGTGTVTVKVFVDTRGDGDPDQPGLAGAEVAVSARTGDPNPTGTTDASGSLTLSDLPLDQDYSATVTGWTLRGGESTGYFRVLADRPNLLLLPLVPRAGGPSASPSVSPSTSVSASASASPGGPASPGASGSAAAPGPGGGGGGVATPPVAPVPVAALARTGSSTAPLFGAGAAVLAAGAAAIAVAYRRRRRFVLPG